MSNTVITVVLMPAFFLAMLLLIEIGRRIGMNQIAEETERTRARLEHFAFS